MAIFGSKKITILMSGWPDPQIVIVVGLTKKTFFYQKIFATFFSEKNNPLPLPKKKTNLSVVTEVPVVTVVTKLTVVTVVTLVTCRSSTRSTGPPIEWSGPVQWKGEEGVRGVRGEERVRMVG